MPPMEREREIEWLSCRYGAPRWTEETIEFSHPQDLEWLRAKRRLSEEVVLTIRRPNGKLLLHTKSFYPTGIYRLPSGSIEEGEGILEAARREAREETGLEVEVEKLLAVLKYRLLWEGESLPFTSYLLLLREKGGRLGTSDAAEAITGFREVKAADLVEVARKLRGLEGRWQAWGQMRARAHKLAADLLAGPEASA